MSPMNSMKSEISAMKSETSFKSNMNDSLTLRSDIDAKTG
jgi:hypothetical protein